MSLFRTKPFRVLVTGVLALVVTDLALVATSSGESSPTTAQHVVASASDVSLSVELRDVKLRASRSLSRRSLPQAHPQVVHSVCWNGEAVVDHPNVRDCPARPASSVGGIPAVWLRVMNCEARSQKWQTNTGNGYYGAFQITWGNAQHYGFARPDLLSPYDQLRLARLILRDQGVGAWPVCGPRAGLYPGA